jgi:hypothetical protein
MNHSSFLRVLLVLIASVTIVFAISNPASSFNFQGMWVGTIKGFAMNHTQMDVYSSENRRSLLFVLAPGVHVTSADGSQHYKLSDLKVGEHVRVHVDMPYGWGYYGYGVSIGSMYITRVDILSGAAAQAQLQHTLRQTLPSPSPAPSPTSPPPVPIIFVSPTPK